jgi:hypothetical protein
MGCWGCYDNENDNVSDIWIDIKDNVLLGADLSDYDYDDEYIIHQNKTNILYHEIKKWIYFCDPEDECYSVNVGIALNVVLLLNPNFKYEDDAVLPINFPEWLRIEALKSTEKYLKDKEKLKKWFNPKERTACLEYQKQLFSNINQT